MVVAIFSTTRVPGPLTAVSPAALAAKLPNGFGASISTGLTRIVASLPGSSAGAVRGAAALPPGSAGAASVTGLRKLSLGMSFVPLMCSL